MSTSDPHPLRFRLATTDDVHALIALRTATARRLTTQFGVGPWSSESTERGVLSGFRDARIFLALRADRLAGTFRLATRKPWAIDRAFFTPVARSVYLTDMAVHPELQRRGVGRACLAHADIEARAMDASAIWLDAYDADAGAGGFYADCGFRACGRKIYRGTPLIYFERVLG
ncbi:MAG: GNAT family N-acetyltransferase [Gemmatimonadaceae bacterium]|nr:GNAT family N-acetyltransferase [Gemmatimonadaceae bacterium]MCC6431223.1 GNAT family N-acetyltransferase [Gemmatimonadaceae bacterium]